MVIDEKFEKIFKEHIKIETYSKSIESLFSPRLKNRIDYKPYYQRNYVWNSDKATYFIESILLGTEIPPLIFFDNNKNIEIIDGRQRFETIMRYMEGQFHLSSKGLDALPQLKKMKFDDLAKYDRKIIEDFLDSKLRIIEFKLVNEPPLDKILEDRIKKEIFSRYNTGITPLKNAEVENAMYDENNLTNYFKDKLKENKIIYQKIAEMFFPSVKNSVSIETVLTFIRRFLVLPEFPIMYFSGGHSRTEILEKLYEKLSDDSTDVEEIVVDEFLAKIDFLSNVYNFSRINSLSINRLALECFLWGFGVLDLEILKPNFNSTLVEKISYYIHNNISSFQEVDSNFYNEINKRYQSASSFFVNEYQISFDLYVKPSEEKNADLKQIKLYGNEKYKSKTIDTIRLQKPEPSRISIDDIRRMMLKRRFLVRPSYQRKEVININKASSIIESVILGITIPAIFIYKREDGIAEVIDGQQRLLTLLGFIGSEYIDENNNSTYSKNNKFKLRKPRILKELDKLSFDDLPEDIKNKIFDFPIYLVEIDQSQNPNFDPIDLFLRLNDKPFPISEHSFEMWNSWVDNDLIEMIKKINTKYNAWYYLHETTTSKDGDRMENEEVITALSYLFYSNANSSSKGLDVYQKKDRINSRIGSKNSISSVLQLATEEIAIKQKFTKCISETELFIKKLKIILLDRDVDSCSLIEYLKTELDKILKAGKITKYFRRTKQDFYLLWFLINGINFEMIKYHRIALKKEISDIFAYIKNIPESDWYMSSGYTKFQEMNSQFKDKYKQAQRILNLNENEKKALIIQQNNCSEMTGAPIFLGDDIEVDHIIPISIGGKDEISNFQILHKDENRQKGSKYEDG